MAARPRTRRQEQAEATREAFVTAARELFGSQGYAATSIEEITGKLNAARGALYHHFASKEALLRAVVEQVEVELMAAMFTAAAKPDDGERSAWERITASCDAFLDFCEDRAVQRILLVDARQLEHDPEAMRRIHTVAAEGLRKMFAESPGVELDAGSVAYALLGILQGLANYVADADDPVQARERAGTTLRQLLAGLRSE